MPVRSLGRVLLATPFLRDGVDAARRPTSHLAAARPAADALTRLTGRPAASDQDLVKVVRAHGILTTVVALALATGKAPRTSALALALLTVPRLVAAQPFTANPAPREPRIKEFAQAAGLLGGALVAAADTQGRPSLAWRIDQAREARLARKEAAE